MKVHSKKILFGLLLALSISLLFYYVLKLIEPSSPPQNVFITNISDHQATISWTTTKPTKGEIIISVDNKFPILPIFTQISYKNDNNTNYLSVVHHVTLNKLQENKTYKFKIYQGLSKAYEGSFMTTSKLSNLGGPSPVYGRILAVDKKTPVIGAIIYFQATNESTRSAILSTMTNSEGRWTLDLSSLRTADFKRVYSLNKQTKEQIIIETGSKTRVKAYGSITNDQPWPDVILK